MFCAKCGYELPNDANFCLRCGASANQNYTETNTVYYLKMNWYCSPCLSASTNQESLGQMIFNNWKSKASMPELVRYLNDKGELFVEYAGVRVRDILKLNKYAYEIRRMYEDLKSYAISNSWVFAQPEVRKENNIGDAVELSCILTKKA